MSGTSLDLNKQNRKIKAMTGSMYLLMMVYAISTTIIGPLMPVYIKQYGIDLAAGGLITALQGLGGFLAVLAGTFIADKVKKTTLIILTFATYIIGVLCLAFLNSYAALIVFFFLIGASTKLLDVALNARVADINASKRNSAVSLLHSFYGIGALAGSFLSAWLLGINLAPRSIFLVLCLSCVTVFTLYLMTVKISDAEQKKSLPKHSESFLTLIKNRRISLLCLSSLLYAGILISVSTWMPLYMQTTFKFGSLKSSLPVTLFMAGVISGRAVCAALPGRYNILRLLFYSHLIIACFWFAAVIINTPVLIIVASGVAGFGVCCAVPVSISIACGWYPEHSGKISSLVILSVTIGITVLPWLCGLLAQLTNFWISIFSLGVLPLAAAICFAMLVNDYRRAG